jgi:hypothetical protein
VVQFGSAPIIRSRRVSRTRLRRRNAGGRFGLDSNSELQVGTYVIGCLTVGKVADRLDECSGGRETVVRVDGGDRAGGDEHRQLPGAALGCAAAGEK